MKGIFQATGNIIQYGNKHLSTVLNMPLDHIIGQSIIDLFGEENKESLQNAIQLLQSREEESDNLIELKPVLNFPKLQLQLNLIEGQNSETIVIGTIQPLIVKEVIQHHSIISRYNALFDHALDGIIIYNYVKEQIITVNAAVVKILEFDKKEEMLGFSRMDLIPKTSKYAPGLDLHEYTDDHKQRVLKGESFSSKGVFTGKYGKEIFFNTKVVPTFNQKGEAVILLQKITKYLADKENHSRVETKYRNIFDNSHEAIIYIDPNNKLPTICNVKAMHMFDLRTLEEVRNIRIYDFVKEQAIDGVAVNKYYQEIVQKVIKNGREETSFWMHKKSGERIRVYAVLIKDNSDSEHPRIICFIRDITELYKAQLALEEKNKVLERYITSNNQLENFAYFASHDLKAPLNTILSFSKLLEKKLVNDERKDVVEFLKFIVTAGDGMKNLIDDLLAYSLVNTTNLEIKEINLEKQLYVLLHSLDSLIKEKAAVIEVKDIPENIVLDPTKLRQVFQNLITNGIKFVQQGQQPKLTISCKEEEAHWLFSVSDNGIGIPQEHQEKIFGLFKRLHSSGDYKGTGIGLAIVKKIIEQHKGTITLESEVGKGTTFQFTIAKNLADLGKGQKVNTANVEIGTAVNSI